MAKVVGLQVGGDDDGSSHVDRAGDHPGRYGGGLLVPGQGGLGVLQVVEDLDGVRGEAGVVIEVDPAGLVALCAVVWSSRSSEAARAGEAARRSFSRAWVRALMSLANANSFAAAGLGLLEGTLGLSTALEAKPRIRGLHGHRGQRNAADLDVVVGAGQAEGLDEVPLGCIVLIDMEGRLARQARQLTSHTEEFTADFVREAACVAFCPHGGRCRRWG
ncbi:hypothetical protein [Streptomyces sp. WM6378]|uniref:hypothetical protein n=1 Tax=Streptomyces sp. WM6378 TaxID=1415557 RepID=UPI00131E166C|nr:hypothetical protein [Streptomyces sp. WM6378]